MALGIVGVLALGDRATGAGSRVEAVGEFWSARDAEGEPLQPRRGEVGLVLAADDQLSLNEPEGPLHRYELVALTAQRLGPTAWLQLDTRLADESGWRLVLATDGDPTLYALWFEPGRDPEVVGRAPVPELADDPFRTFRLAVKLDGARFAAAVDGIEKLRWTDARRPDGGVVVTARDGALRLTGLEVRGKATNQRGQQASLEWRDDFGRLTATSRWPLWIARTLGCLLVLLVAALYLRALGHRPAVPSGRWALIDATLLWAAPAGGLLALAAVLPGARLPGWLEPALWTAGLLGFLVAWRRLAGSSETPPTAPRTPTPTTAPGGASPPSGRADRKSLDSVARRGTPLGIFVAVLLTALTTVIVLRANDRARAPGADAEQLALQLPLPDAVTVPGPLTLGPHNDLTLPGPYRDIELSADIELAAGAALQLRLRADDPGVPAGLTLVVSADPRRASSFRREEPWAFERIGESRSPDDAHVADVAAGQPHRLVVTTRGHELAATLDGEFLAGATDAEHPSGALVLLAAPGRVLIRDLKVVAIPHALGPPASTALPTAGLLLGGLLVLGLMARFATGQGTVATLQTMAFALVPLAAALSLGAPDGRLAIETLGRAALGGVILAIQPLLVARHRSAGRVILAALVTAALVPTLFNAVTVRAAIPRTAFLNGMSYAHWDGTRAHDDLLWLEQPLLRRWNPYLSQHRFRGRQFAIPKPDGVRRVVALGGSSTWGFRLPEASADDWPTVLETVLSEGPLGAALGDVRIEVINGAWSGAIGDRLFRFLRDVLIDFEPDVLVLCLYYNDAFALSAGDEEAYYAAITAPDFERSAWSHWTDARAAAAGRAQLRALMDAMGPHQADRPASTQAAWDELGLPNDGRSPPQRFEAMLRRFADFAAAHELGLVLVKEPLADDQPKLWKDEFYAVIDRVGEQRGLLVVDPRASLEAAGDAALFLDEIHLTPRGHAVMADVVAPAVAAELARRP